MSLSAIGDIGLRFQRLSALAAQDALVRAPATRSASSTYAPASSASTAANYANSGSNSSDALAQNVQLFMQALYEALSMADAATTTATLAAANGQHSASSGYNPPQGLTYSNRGSVGLLRSSPYQQGQQSLQAKIQSLIAALSEQQDGSDDANGDANSNVGSLQSAFNRFLRDLGASSSGAGAASGGGAGNVLTLRGWLQGLQHSLQQPGASSFSALGNMVDVVA